MDAKELQWEDLAGLKVEAVGWGSLNYVVIRFTNGIEFQVDADSAFDMDGMRLDPAGMADI